MTGLTIKGIQEAQRKNLQRMAAMKPEGRLGNAVRSIALEAHRYMTSVTHVDTGAYKASNRVSMIGLTAKINVDTSAVNPHGGKPVIYSVYEEARGGDHAAYALTGAQIKGGIVQKHLSAFGASLR